jgi:hypothetical protein
MNIQTKELYSHTLHTPGGDIGHVKDLYFDDRNWAVRYLVTDTGSWLSGRKVLISPQAFGGVSLFGHVAFLLRADTPSSDPGTWPSPGSTTYVAAGSASRSDSPAESGTQLSSAPQRISVGIGAPARDTISAIG